MGNAHCPAEDTALLASVARDICPFPNYNPNPVYMEMLMLNSSHHLSSHYAAVQSSLTPKQLEDFTGELRRTFGREGKVTLGGVGVVALSLAILFDTLAKQVKGEPVQESSPIPNLFLKNPMGFYPSNVKMVSEYLRLIPHLANNPERMVEESIGYMQEMKLPKPRTEREKRLLTQDISSINQVIVQIFRKHVQLHLYRITNSTEYVADMSLADAIENPVNNTECTSSTTTSASHAGKTRKRRFLAPAEYDQFSLNCNPEEASRVFMEEVEKSNHTKAAWEKCQPHLPTKSRLHHIASLAWLDDSFNPVMDFDSNKQLLMNQKGDFDLKGGALGKWIE